MIMTNAQQQLAEIGFGSRPREPACWRTVRLDAPPPRRSDYGIEPACSPTLLSWRRVLRLNCRNSPYRISRIER
jgi:hypothetical protein